MELDEKASWNKKYSEGSHGSLDPDPFLVSAYDEFLASRSPGIALDVAGGVGRHAIWLAQRGWRVKLMDISEVGIQQAEENAKRTGTAGSISSEVRDLNIMQDLGENNTIWLSFSSFSSANSSLLWRRLSSRAAY